ncbi:hypothetical protein KCU78_g17, partial [Aureobasidium melanogenum]
MVATCKRPRMIILATMGHLRPHLSPAKPNIAAPTDRKRRSVKVESISSPSGKTNNEEDPIHCSKLRH